MSKALQKQLKTFIDRVDAQEKLAEDSSKDNAYEEEYRVLRTLGQTNKEEKRFPTEEGRKDENIKKNRYKDILPFDATRVPLTLGQDEPGSDYINANFITGANGKVAYIASQGPLPHTVPDFWRMLWQYKVEVIVMVCQLVENAKVKCEKYWSNNPSEVKQIGNFHIKTENLVVWDDRTTLKIERWEVINDLQWSVVHPGFFQVDEEKVNPYFIVRTLSVWHTKKEAAARTLTQFHYTGWMDHDIPNDVSDIIQLINRMRAKQTSESPAVIHCSAGCGRTGTICAIDYAWSVLKGGTMTEDFSLYDIILNMRSQRQSMVQTPDQYRVVHLAVRAMFEEHLQLIGDHNYENFDLNKDGKLKNRSIPHTKGAAPQPDTGSKPINHGNVISPTKPAVTDSKANPSKPSSLNIPVSGSDKTKTSKAPGAEKKPAADSKPLLSPKPVTTPETLPAHNSSNATNSTALKAGAKRSPGYQNVELDDIIQLSKPNSGTSSKPQQQISQPQRPPKTTIHSKADVPNSSDTRRTSADKKSVSKSNYENSNPPSKISDQPSSHALQEVKSADDDNRMSVPYAVVSKTSKTPTTPPSSISKRGPALLPPSAGKNSTTDYEVVSIPKGRQDYSYAEPNSTEKWEFQGLARSFDQKGHAPGRGTPGEAYEEVDVNKSHPKPLKVPGVSSPTYTGHVDQEKKKTGIIDTLKSKMSSTGKLEPEPTATKDKHLKELASVVMNKKEILGRRFNQRGKRPVGPRRMPVGWRYESSL